MVAGESITRQFTPYKDGVITSRNTFQRYYTQSEFKAYLEGSLGETAIAAGQGVFYCKANESPDPSNTLCAFYSNPFKRSS